MNGNNKIVELIEKYILKDKCITIITSSLLSFKNFADDIYKNCCFKMYLTSFISNFILIILKA